MAPPLADVATLAARLKVEFDEPDTDQAELLLAQASAIVRSYTGRTFTDADGDLIDPLPDGVSGVVIEMVTRVAQNPEGATQDTAGPYSVSFGPNAAERLYLSSGDRIVLDPLKRTGGLRTIPTTRGPVETPSAARFTADDL